MTHSPRLNAYLDRLVITAQARGDATALSDERRSVSYYELLQEINDRAASLSNAGLQSGDRVAFVAENSADYVISALAVWQADGVPVTIFPSTSEADLKSTLIDADPALVLCDSSTVELVRSAARRGVPVVTIDGEFAPNQVAGDTRPTPAEARDQLALICYSSGTTSRPKAIMLSARAIANSSQTFSEAWRLDANDVTLVCLPMAWLYGLTTASLSTLYVGGTLVSRRRSTPELVATAIQDHGVTVLPAVTTVLTKLANFLTDSDQQRRLDSLRLIVSGGEPRNEQSFALLRTFTGIAVHDNYCASEMQPLATYDPVTDPEPRQGSAGKLVARSQLRIVDAEGNDVGRGEVGEGLSYGPGIMLGYWNDPGLTAGSLTDDGWYRTKDLLRMDDDGYIYVVGRTSDMIIRGGSNVSPSEVEAHLRQHSAVIDVAVVGVPDPLYGEEIVAVLQVRHPEQFSADAFRDFARTGLSGFKAPTRYVRVDQLPHNSTTNKVDRKAVKKMLEAGFSS